MKKSTKIWLVIATCLLLAVGIIFGGVMTMLKWDFTKLSTVKYETNKHEITEAFNSITIRTNTSDVNILPTEGNKCEIVCIEKANLKHTVTVDNGELKIILNDTRRWYEHIGISFAKTEITAYIPKTLYESVTVVNSTGRINIEELCANTLSLSLTTGKVTASNINCNGSFNLKQSTGDALLSDVSCQSINSEGSTGSINIEEVCASTLSLSRTTGKVTASKVNCNGSFNLKQSTGDTFLSDVSCQSLNSEGTTGSITLKNVIASDKISIERSTGNIKFDLCDAAQLEVETDTGSVTGTFLTDKIFFAETETGKIDVPKSTTGGTCEVETDTGDIILKIK